MINEVPLTVIIITLNEEENIEACLQSVGWAKERIVIDSRSTDSTVGISRRFTSHVYETDWRGFGAAKQFGLERATQEWVLWLDADERVTPELACEIAGIVSSSTGKHNGYEVARRAYFLGKWIKHCGWYPGYVVRLFRKKAARFNTSRVHEKLELPGIAGKLQNDLLHYTDENLFHYFAKFNRYTSLAAEDVGGKGHKYSFYDLLIRPPFMFIKMYLLRLGFLDGMHGLILSLLSAAYVFTKYVKVWELQSNRQH